MQRDEIIKSSLYHIPSIKTVASDIFNAPTIFSVKLESSYCLNSRVILSRLNTQTMVTEIDKMT
jgi:hypothetical protein